MATMKAGFDIDHEKKYLHLIENLAATFATVWLVDKTIPIEQNPRFRDITKELQLHLCAQDIRQYVAIHHDVRRCIDELRQLTNRTIILFISRDLPLNEADSSEICGLPHVEYIYQLGSNVSCIKIRGELLNKNQQLLETQSDLYTIPDQVNGLSGDNLSNAMKKCLIKQILLLILEEFECTENENRILIDFLLNNCNPPINHQYVTRHLQSGAIECYTGTTFIPALVSKTLRQGYPVSMIQIHHFIHRLYSELKPRYHQQFDRLNSGLVIYRGTTTNIHELDQFLHSKGKHVLTNSFVSCSMHESVALAFNAKDQPLNETDVSLLIEIHIAPNCLPLKPMPLVNDIVREGYENELLLSAGILFLLQSVERIKKDMWKIILIRDVEVLSFEQNFSSILLTQINLIKFHLSADQSISEEIPSDLSNEDKRALINFLRKWYSETSNLSTTQDDTIISINDQANIPDPSPLPQPTRNQQTNLRTRLERCFRRCSPINIKAVCIVLSLTVLLIIILLIALSTKITISAENDGSSTDFPPSRCPKL